MENDNENLVEINEPLSEYFKSEKFLKSFKTLTISSIEEQENANLEFSAILKPIQRLEYLYILNQRFLSQFVQNIPEKYSGEIIIDY